MDRMEYHYVIKSDDDKKLKFDKQEFFCFSCKKFKKELSDNAIVCGRITTRTKEDKDKEKSRSDDTTVLIKEKSYTLYDDKDKGGLLKRKVGYILTDDGKYVLLVKSRIPIILLFFFGACLMAAGIIIGGSMLNKEPPTPPVPPPDSNAGLIIDDTESSDDSDNNGDTLEDEGGGSVRLSYSLNANLTTADGKISMYFANPKASNQSITLELCIVNGDNLIKIAQSGRIDPGQGINIMEFIPDSAILETGTYNAMYIVSCYDVETGEKALVQPRIQDVALVVI